MADTATVKSTININKDYFEELKLLISENRLSSLTEGINKGIAMYLSQERKKRYALAMEEASKDPNFINRTMASQSLYDGIEDTLW